jgi:hypothetical protein
MVAASQPKGTHIITTLEWANWADKAILAFREQTGRDLEDSLGDLLGDLMHWADARNFDFDAALDRARHQYEEECEKEETDRLPEAVRDLIEALEQQTEAAQAVVNSWEQGDLANAVNGLEHSLDGAVAALAKVKGCAA